MVNLDSKASGFTVIKPSKASENIRKSINTHMIYRVSYWTPVSGTFAVSRMIWFGEFVLIM